ERTSRRFSRQVRLAPESGHAPSNGTQDSRQRSNKGSWGGTLSEKTKQNQNSILVMVRGGTSLLNYVFDLMTQFRVRKLKIPTKIPTTVRPNGLHRAHFSTQKRTSQRAARKGVGTQSN
ncbi:MAG: hypothetical protein WB689_21335, partial [Xanthobacteraceae bacterium]